MQAKECDLARSARLLVQFRETGRTDLFETFYRLNEAWINAYAALIARRGRRNPDPEEISAELFYDLYRRASPFTSRGGPAFKRWMQVLVKNKIRKWRRACWNSRRSVYPGLPEKDDRDQGNPLTRLLLRETEGDLLRGRFLLIMACLRQLARLSTAEREMLRMHLVEGLTYKEIAAGTGVSPEKAAALGRRARRKWLRALQGRSLARSKIRERDQTRLSG